MKSRGYVDSSYLWSVLDAYDGRDINNFGEEQNRTTSKRTSRRHRHYLNVVYQIGLCAAPTYLSKIASCQT